ncbi:type IV secretion system protein VirB10 [Ectopseudomonas alcaliphila]|uniref:Type IV secretion system protein VirB10 n=1 Tax=Ectopseudomonas alcaliphila TaxID=101564 RepID=A0A1G7JIP5_9GAMM|nr:type IV secretion system protein VirB10 [Pseudomonas alcaliphila]
MTANDDKQTAATSLPAKEAPESLELRAKPRPVTRLNHACWR